MSDIYLYTNDLELGTKLTNRLLQIEHSIRFLDSLIASFNKNSIMLVDLDDAESNPEVMQRLSLNHPKLRLIGFMTRIQKQRRDEYHRSGCERIYLRSTLIKNPESILFENDPK